MASRREVETLRPHPRRAHRVALLNLGLASSARSRSSSWAPVPRLHNLANPGLSPRGDGQSGRRFRRGKEAQAKCAKDVQSSRTQKTRNCDKSQRLEELSAHSLQGRRTSAAISLRLPERQDSGLAGKPEGCRFYFSATTGLVCQSFDVDGFFVTCQRVADKGV